MRANTIGMRFVAGCVAAVGFGGSEAIAQQNIACGISTATVNALQSKLATVIHEPDAMAVSSSRTGCGRQS